MLTVMLDSLVPVFFGMALGYLAGWMRDVDNRHVAELNALVMDFAVPASMFVTVVQASRRTLLDELPLAANLSLSMLILYGATYVMARHAFGAAPGEASIQTLTPSLLRSTLAEIMQCRHHKRALIINATEQDMR